MRKWNVFVRVSRHDLTIAARTEKGGARQPRRICLVTLFAIPFLAVFLVTASVRAQIAPHSHFQPLATAPHAAKLAPAVFRERPPANSSEASLFMPLKSEDDGAPYVPITPRQRLRWFVTSTIGPASLAGGVISSAFGTAINHPREYGPGWKGFGERYGMRLTGVSTENAMEATVGALWGEDPRYFRDPDATFGGRLRHVVVQAFLARRRDGSYGPAYARYLAISGSNFLSNTWRADSEANAEDAVLRIAEGFAGRMAGNAFEEFWPSVKRRLFHKKR